MAKQLYFLLIILNGLWLVGQEQVQYLNGTVENESTGFPMESVHILNLNKVEGTTTDNKGNFEILAQVNDTLYFSYLGYKSFKVAVTQDMIKFGNSKFQITELAFALEEIILRPYQLTGYLDIDVKNVPINSAGRYRIPGLPSAGYEGGNRNPNAISKTFAALFNPADFLHNLFGKKGVQMQKLKKMRENDELKNLLASKFDREIITQLLNLERVDLDEILRNCNYSDVFIKESNDLQILEAISGCYEEYRVLQL
ncbi:MAG: carboxypeptidase-like regulatory domain-containing protein [Flavobacteriaceae bacterium]|jgi:hypothetical protein